MKAWLTAACAVGVLAASDAYTASNGVAGAAAGAGIGSISGYAISDVRYELDGATVSAVSFSLDPPEARTARIRVSPAGGWFPCTIDTGVASCAVGGVSVTELERLVVVAAG